MTQNTTSQPAITQPVTPAPRKPNEKGSITVTGVVKIYDPKTKETFVETRT